MASDSTPAWTITEQREDYRQLPSGQFGMGVVVTFRTAGGVTGTVFVPQDQYTVEQVKSLVGPRAAAMDAVAGLTG